MIKRKILLALAILLFSIPVMAQRNEKGVDKEKLEAAKVAFITNRLNLTPEQAERFWPLYNKYDENRMKIMGKIHGLYKSAENDLNDAKAKRLIDERFKLQDELQDLEKRFLEEITSVISPAQAFKLSEAKRDFTRQLYQMQRRGSRNN